MDTKNIREELERLVGDYIPEVNEHEQVMSDLLQLIKGVVEQVIGQSVELGKASNRDRYMKNIGRNAHLIDCQERLSELLGEEKK